MRFLFLLIFTVLFSSLHAGMAIYFVIGKDSNPVTYRIFMNSGTGNSAHSSLYRIVKHNLITKDDVDFLRALRETTRYKITNSGDIVSGYYVIIDNGSRFETYPRYGAGFSEKSRFMAELDARDNLSGNDWDWYYKKHGSKIIETNIFPDSKCSRAFNKCLKKANSALDKKKCAMDKKKCQGPASKQSSDKTLKTSTRNSSGVRG